MYHPLVYVNEFICDMNLYVYVHTCHMALPLSVTDFPKSWAAGTLSRALPPTYTGLIVAVVSVTLFGINICLCFHFVYLNSSPALLYRT